MANEYKILVLSDLQDLALWGLTQETRHAFPAAAFLSKLAEQITPDAVVLNGDVTPALPDLNHDTLRVNRMAQFYKALRNAFPKADVYVQPGSWETTRVIDALRPVYDALEFQLMEGPALIPDENLTLAFLPGSDSHPHPLGLWGYQLHEEREGRYSHFRFIRTLHGVQRIIASPVFVPPKRLEELLQEHADPNETIIFSHVPPPFEFEKSVDAANAYARPRKEGGIDVVPASVYERLPSEQKQGWKHITHAGVPGLERIVNLNPAGWVSGHIEEAAGNAHTREGKPVKEGEFVKGLYVNASGPYMVKQGITGLFAEGTAYLVRAKPERDGVHVAYQPIQIGLPLAPQPRIVYTYRF